jgi:cytochrome c oxidase subunit 2
MFSRIFNKVHLFTISIFGILVSACSRDDLNVRQSTLDPKGPVAQMQFDVFMDTVWLVVILFALVGGLLVYAVIKFRARPGQDARPKAEKGHGNPLIEIGLITASIGALVFIAIPTLSAIWYTDDVPAEAIPTSKLSAWYPQLDENGKENYSKELAGDVLEIDVIGKQWWFRFEYPQLGLTSDAKHTVPNEIVIPRGKAVRLNLRSEDVIHSFWLPKIAGKVDLMPGRKNKMWIQGDQAGHYYGQCAEFCGDSHAYMLFRCNVVEPEEFAKWVKEQKKEAAPVEPNSKAEKGKALFAAKTCAMCHNISGHFGAGNFGPDLTHIASRRSLAGAWMDNRERKAQLILETQTKNTESTMPVDPAVLKANLIKWIGSSGTSHGIDGKPSKDVKPGNRMHYYKMFNVVGLNESQQKFTAEELDCLAEYLLTLK